MEKLDPRLNAYRDDIADITLKNRVRSNKYISGIKRQVNVPVTDIKKIPKYDSGTGSQLILGDNVLVFEDRDGFSFIRSLEDGYVGYVVSDHLSDNTRAPTHRLKMPRSFIYPKADLKASPVCAISINSKVAITHFEETNGKSYALLEDGRAIVAQHLEEITVHTTDFVSVAENLIHTPYLWGGTSAFGIDCSALVQLSMAMTGCQVLRDSDMQQNSIGDELSDGSSLQRGDLIFWKGHVAIMVDCNNLIHANGTSMDVRIESTNDAIKRIARDYDRPTSYRRPKSL